MIKPLHFIKRLLPLFLMLWGLFGFGNFANLQAQIFPIRIIPTVIPPAPVYLFNYADRMALNSPLRVQLMLNDFTISNRQIRLKVYIEGSGIRTESKDFVAGAIPLTIDGGVPLFLTNAELAPYFEIQNLKGISPRMYGQSLREGSYRFCFEVYDFMTNRKLGNKTCATTFIYKNEPPILNFPKNKTTIKPRPVENIVFQWTPRHINVTNVQYELSIVEIWDDYVDPRTAFMTSPPIFQTTIRTTSFVYGAAQPLLMTNRRYAWQVKAKALKGLEEIGLFRNRGESEIFWFTKAEICQPPANVYGEPKGMSKINIYWDEDYNTYSEYEITYRQKDRPNSRWFTKRTNAGWATIWNLKEGTTYEYKVRGKCKYNYSPYSKLGVVTTATREDKSSNYNCGIVSDMKTITNREGLDNILIGDRFLAGGNFMVFITDLTSENHGVISGSGFVRVPYLGDARFAVTFNNILINTDYELVEGEVVTVYDPIFGEDAQMTVDLPISEWLENISNVITGLREEVQEAVATGTITEEQANDFENQISEQEVLKEEIETELAKGEKQDEAKIKENRAKVDQITEDIKSSLADYETNKKMTSSGEGGIQGDSFFDGVIPFTTLDKKINFTPTDNSSSGNKELKLDVNKKDSLYFTRNIINRSNTSAYYVSQSNQTRDVLEQNEEYVKYKSDFLSFTKSQDKFGLWIHYDLDANEVKYKVAFNQNYFNNLIAKEDFISLLNKVLTYDLSGGIGSSIVSASEGISKLIEEYKDVYPELSQDLIKGYSTYELLSLITDFIKKCGKGVSNQAESTIVPRCLWDTEQTLFITYAYIAGFIDAGWSVVDGGVGMAKFMAAWSPVNPVFFTEEGSRIRKETLAAAAIIGELYNSEEKRDKAISAIFDQIIAYTDSTLSLDAQGRYQQGKLFFEVAGIFFGITELKIFLKTGKVTSSFLTGLRKLGKGGHRLILTLGKKLKVDKNKIVTYLMAANLQYEIARFGDDGVLIAKNWLDNPIEVIENIGEIPIKKSDKAVESIAEIGIVKGSDGSVGLGLLNKISKAGGGLAKAWKSGWSKQKVLDIPKGSRPKPSTYLDQKYIDEHLAKFDDGASYLAPKDALDRFGRNPVGRPDGQFVMSKNEMDDLFDKADGDLSIIEKELGIPSGLWKDKELVRIDIPNPKESNIRIPDGNEGGANELWLPGGKLPNGYSEAVLDAIPEGQYTETITKLK